MRRVENRSDATSSTIRIRWRTQTSSKKGDRVPMILRANKLEICGLR